MIMIKKTILLSGCAFLLLGSCKQTSEKDSISPDSLSVKAINDASLSQYLSVIAADSLAGRKPFTSGETKTINYLKNEFEKLGLEPGN